MDFEQLAVLKREMDAANEASKAAANAYYSALSQLGLIAAPKPKNKSGTAISAVRSVLSQQGRTTAELAAIAGETNQRANVAIQYLSARGEAKHDGGWPRRWVKA
ncbi:MAG TPA: hypothetical protein VI653_13385 [Steroidobacteraceae bacterium]